jgi:hypothetical protein
MILHPSSKSHFATPHAHSLAHRTAPFSLLLVLLLLAVIPAAAQTLRVQAANGETSISARLGEVVRVELFADLGSFSTSGIALFVRLPTESFQIVDIAPDADGIQPFLPGALFLGASEFANRVVPSEQTPDLTDGTRLLEYQLALSSSGNRARTGSGAVATFSLLCVRTVEEAVVRLHSSPVNQIRLLLADGSERPVLNGGELSIAVRAIKLKDIPDLNLLPGQIDSTRIGRLDRFLLDNRAQPDSLRWSFSGFDIDSLNLKIGPDRRVRIEPIAGWTGKRRITWTVSEPRSALAGQTPPSASDISDIVVNTPPRFRTRRDTVYLREDEFTFRLPTALEPDPARAFLGRDLDSLVIDPEARDIHTAFRYGVLHPRVSIDTLAQVRGRVTPLGHFLLLWSRPDYAGIDSLRVVVADEFTVGRVQGQDTLRVIIFVEEVPDAPHFVFAEQVVRLSPGESRSIALADFVADVDTPLDSLAIDWTLEATGAFSADIFADSLVLSAPNAFVGQGLFRFVVSDPQGLADTLALRVVSDPLDGGTGEPPDSSATPDTLARPNFSLRAPPSLAVQSGQRVDSIPLDSLVIGQPGRLIWSLRTLDEELNALVSIDANNRVNLFGLNAGEDSVLFTAADVFGRRRTAAARIEVLTAATQPALQLLPMPDFDFVAKHLYDEIDLDDFVGFSPVPLDSLRWSAQFIGPASVLVQIRPDRSVLMSSSAAANTEVVFAASYPPLRLSARDTVRISAVDSTQGNLALRTLPRLLFAPGGSDTTLSLDPLIEESFAASDTVWRVSGQTLFSAAIDARPPHRLRIRHTGAIVGLDTLLLTVELGRGYRARGALYLAAAEQITSDALRIRLVPNPLGRDFITVYVLADRDLLADPTARRFFAGGEEVITLRQLVSETSIKQRIWSGQTALPTDATGDISFNTTAHTALGTPLEASTALTYARVRRGKETLLRRGDIEVKVPPHAVADGTPLVLIVDAERIERADQLIELYPADLELATPALLRGAFAADAALYHQGCDGWRWIAALRGETELAQWGRYIVARESFAAPTTPTQFSLGYNYPNPFNAGTAIPFSLGQRERVRLWIFNAAGQRVRTLIDEALLAAGHYESVWNGTDDGGQQVGSGIYIYRLQAGIRTEHGLMVRIK